MTKARTLVTNDSQPTAIIIATQSPANSEAEMRASHAELEHLLRGIGVRSGPTVYQRRAEPHAATVLGAGKLEELKAIVDGLSEDREAKLVLVFDGELSPGQQRNLAREFDVEVIDRTQVILRVFAQRARTRTAQLEIELVQLQYEAPRVRDDEAVGTRQSGGGGRAAKGHTSVELRKQQLRKRLTALREELASAVGMQSRRRMRREQVSRAALVGYTNAGKSSWMRALTKSEVLVQNALFATLDTTVRVLHPATTPRIMMADTVGFLRNLPNHLLASFRSTLDEALDADLLVLVVDGSDPEWAVHLETTREVLRQVEALELPNLILVNKMDQMSELAQSTLSEALPDALMVSARSDDDVARVHRHIANFFEQRLEAAELLIPFEKSALRAEIWANARVLSEHCDETGARLCVRAESVLLSQWARQLGESEAVAP